MNVEIIAGAERLKHLTFLLDQGVTGEQYMALHEGGEAIQGVEQFDVNRYSIAVKFSDRVTGVAAVSAAVSSLIENVCGDPEPLDVENDPMGEVTEPLVDEPKDEDSY
jgi:hypothetical protein